MFTIELTTKARDLALHFGFHGQDDDKVFGSLKNNKTTRDIERVKRDGQLSRYQYGNTKAKISKAEKPAGDKNSSVHFLLLWLMRMGTKEKGFIQGKN